MTVRSCGKNIWFTVLSYILLFSAVELSQPSIPPIQLSVGEIYISLNFTTEVLYADVSVI